MFAIVKKRRGGGGLGQCSARHHVHQSVYPTGYLRSWLVQLVGFSQPAVKSCQPLSRVCSDLSSSLNLGADGCVGLGVSSKRSPRRIRGIYEARRRIFLVVFAMVNLLGVD